MFLIGFDLPGLTQNRTQMLNLSVVHGQCRQGGGRATWAGVSRHFNPLSRGFGSVPGCPSPNSIASMEGGSMTVGPGRASRRVLGLGFRLLVLGFRVLLRLKLQSLMGRRSQQMFGLLVQVFDA